MADLYIVGQFKGSSSISAVSIGSQFMHLLTVIIIGLAMGSTIKIGHAVGGKKYQKVPQIIGNTFLLFLSLAVILTIILCINTSNIIQVMSTPQEAISETYDYLLICIIGIPFIVAYNVMSSIFRGIGDSKSPMYFIMIACIVNVVLDYYFIGVLSMGAKGAALATVIAQALSSIIALFCLSKKKFQFTFHLSDLKMNRQTMKGIISSGLPIAMQDGFIQLSFLIITIIANSRGLIMATSVGIVEKIISFLFLVPSAFLSALSALIAQNIGAQKTQRAQKMLGYGLTITVLFGFICLIICQIIPNQLIALFTGEQDVILHGSEYLRAYAFDCMFAAVHFCFSGYFCGSGHSDISFIHNIISVICIRIPGSYLATKMFVDTLFPMGLAAPCGSILSAFICVGFYQYLKKKDIKHVVHE